MVGRQTGRALGADKRGWPGGAGGPPPPRRKSTKGGSPPPVSAPGTPRKEGELCPLEAMLRGIGEPESWLMDCSPPQAAWELPPPLEEGGGELGSLEEAVTDCAGPSPTASSLWSWAEECERADAALAAAEAQMGRGCGEENPEGAAALNGDLLMEEDGEWMVALKEALAPRPGETGGQPKGRQRATKAVQGSPPTRGGQKKPEQAAGKGTAAPTGVGAAAQGSAAGKIPHPQDQEEDEV